MLKFIFKKQSITDITKVRSQSLNICEVSQVGSPVNTFQIVPDRVLSESILFCTELLLNFWMVISPEVF